jgi:hypothetical protein
MRLALTTRFHLTPGAAILQHAGMATPENPLARYLKRNGLTVSSFARSAALDRASVYRIATGGRGCGMWMAKQIEKATGGAVSVSDWPAKPHRPPRRAA